MLTRLREEVIDGKYALVLGFDSTLPMEEWEVRLPGSGGDAPARSLTRVCPRLNRRAAPSSSHSSAPACPPC